MVFLQGVSQPSRPDQILCATVVASEKNRVSWTVLFVAKIFSKKPGLGG